MATEGEKLKEYVQSKRMNVTKLAAQLGMSKQNLYQIFRSKEIQPETKKKIEKVLHINWKVIDAVNIDDNIPQIEPQLQEPSTPYGAWDKIADSNQRLAKSMEIMANLLQEKEATMKEIKASLAQIPEDMYALSAKLLEGQQHIYDLVGQVKDEVKKPHGKAPAPLKKR